MSVYTCLTGICLTHIFCRDIYFSMSGATVQVHPKFAPSQLFELLQKARLKIQSCDISCADIVVANTFAVLLFAAQDVNLNLKAVKIAAAKFKTQVNLNKWIGFVLLEHMTEHFLEFQRFVVMQLELTIVPIQNYEEVAGFVSRLSEQVKGGTAKLNADESDESEKSSADDLKAAINLLCQCPTIGEAKAKLLLKEFGTLLAVSAASTEKLTEVIGCSAAKQLKNWTFNNV